MKQTWSTKQLIPYESGTVQDISIKDPVSIKGINLDFAADLVVTDPGAGADGAVVENATAKLIRSITVKANGGITIFQASGEELYYKNWCEYGNEHPVVLDATAGAAATYPIYLNLKIDFENMIGARRFDTYLPAFKLNTLKILVEWAAPSICFGSTHTMVDTIARTFGMSCEVINTSPVEVSLIRIQSAFSSQIVATQNGLRQPMDANMIRTYQSIMIKTAVNTATEGYAQNDATITQLSLVSNSSDYHIQEKAWVAAQRTQQMMLKTATIPPGILYLYFLEDGNIGSGLKADKIDSITFILNAVKAATDTRMTFFYDAIQPVATILKSI